MEAVTTLKMTGTGVLYCGASVLLSTKVKVARPGGEPAVYVKVFGFASLHVRDDTESTPAGAPVFTMETVSAYLFGGCEGVSMHVTTRLTATSEPVTGEHTTVMKWLTVV